jgi:hypothetical protein
VLNPAASIALRIHVIQEIAVVFCTRIATVTLANVMAIACILESTDSIGGISEYLWKGFWPTTVPGQTTTKLRVFLDVDSSKVGKVLLVALWSFLVSVFFGAMQSPDTLQKMSGCDPPWSQDTITGWLALPANKLTEADAIQRLRGVAQRYDDLAAEPDAPAIQGLVLECITADELSCFVTTVGGPGITSSIA